MSKSKSIFKLIIIAVIGSVIAGVFVLHYEYSFLKIDNSKTKNLNSSNPFSEKEINTLGRKINGIEFSELKKAEDGNSTQDIYFPLVGSFQDKKRAISFANSIVVNKQSQYPIKVYYAGNNWYTVSLGGFLNKEEANLRVRYAKNKKIANDAFIWGSSSMSLIDF